jgi:hypothetical protein
LYHLVMVPSVTVSPSWGIRMSAIATGLSLQAPGASAAPGSGGGW